MAEMIKSDQVTPPQLAEILEYCIKARLPIMVKGRPGVGKTDIIQQATDKANARLIISHPVVSDPTDYKGAPWVSINLAEIVLLAIKASQGDADARRDLENIAAQGPAPTLYPLETLKT